MTMVRDILRVKGSEVVLIQPEATVLAAATLMNERKVGALVISDRGTLQGIFTERDILLRIVAQRRDPGTTRVEEVMSREVACCQLHTTLDEARSVMKNRRIRHLPVLADDQQLCGLISIGDLNAHDADSKETTIQMMQAYIHGHVR